MSSSFFASMYLYLGEGTVIIITNSVLVYSILGKKKNRERREFLLIVAQALADTFYAIAFMLIAVHRLELAATGEENGNSTVWECALQPALPFHNWATPLLGLLPLTTSMNFLICSVFPLWYLHVGWNYTIVLLSSPHAVSLFLSVLNYILLWRDLSPTSALCVAAKGAAHHLTYGAMLFLRMVANLASALIYAAIILYLRKSHHLRELSVQQRKLHRNAAITLGCVTLNSMTLLFIPDLLLFFNPRNITKDYSTLLYSMTLSKTMINFFIYMWRYGELADMVTSSTCRKVPHLQKYFSERSTGFRSSQVGDTSVARITNTRIRSHFSGETRKAPVGKTRATAKISPKQLEAPEAVNEPRALKEPKQNILVREPEQPEAAQVDKSEDLERPEETPEDLPRTEEKAEDQQPLEDPPQPFLPHIEPTRPFEVLDIRSFWSNY